MNPANIDRAGKGFLAVIGFAILAAAKKYGPKIVESLKNLKR